MLMVCKKLDSKSLKLLSGAFDLFHMGHMELLKKAKALGTYLIVGVHDDKIVNEFKGSVFYKKII